MAQFPSSVVYMDPYIKDLDWGASAISHLSIHCKPKPTPDLTPLEPEPKSIAPESFSGETDGRTAPPTTGGTLS